jgi:hypothetical protein
MSDDYSNPAYRGMGKGVELPPEVLDRMEPYLSAMIERPDNVSFDSSLVSDQVAGRTPETDDTDPWATVKAAYAKIGEAGKQNPMDPVRLTREQVRVLRYAHGNAREEWDPENLAQLSGSIGDLSRVRIEIVDSYAESTPAVLALLQTLGKEPEMSTPRNAVTVVPVEHPPVEAKVKTGALAAGITGAALSALSLYVFGGGDVPEPVAGIVTTAVGGLVTWLVTFAVGFATRHTARWIRVTPDAGDPLPPPQGRL